MTIFIMKRILLTIIFILFLSNSIFSKEIVYAEKGPYKNGISIFRIETNLSNPYLLIGVGWGSKTGFWDVNSKCYGVANNDIYSFQNIKRNTWLLEIKQFELFTGSPPAYVKDAEPVFGIQISSTRQSWWWNGTSEKYHFLIEENEPGPCDNVPIEDLGFENNDPEGHNKINSQYKFKIKGPSDINPQLWINIGMDNDIKTYSVLVDRTELEILSNENCEGVHVFNFYIRDIFGTLLSEDEISNINFFTYGLKDQNGKFILDPKPTDNPIRFYKDSCIIPVENIKISSSKKNYLYNDIPINARITTSLVNPQLKISLFTKGVETFSACLSLGEGKDEGFCISSENYKLYTLELILRDIFASSSINWLLIEEVQFTICNSECISTAFSKKYNYEGHNQIILSFKQYESQISSLEDYLIINQLIPQPMGYLEAKMVGDWKMDYDYFMEDTYIKLPSNPNWDRGVSNYPYKLSHFPIQDSPFRFARYQNTMGFYNWSSHSGSTGVALPGGLVHTKPWVNTQHTGEFTYWVVDGQYSDSHLLANSLGVPYVKLKVFIEPAIPDVRAWIPIHSENYDELTQKEAENLKNSGITSYHFADKSKGWPQDGQYMISDRVTSGSNGGVPLDWNWEFRDHTSGNGQMYIVNADINQKGLFYKHTMDICPGTTARLSAWFLNLCNGTFSDQSNYYPGPNEASYDNRLYRIKPNVQMRVLAKVWENNSQKEVVLANGYTGEIQFTTQWEQHFVEFEVPSNVVGNSITVEFLNLYRGGQGNDFAIDDIQVERLKCDLELETPSPACYDRPEFTIAITEKSLYEYYKLKVYPDKIYFNWTRERWNGNSYESPELLDLGDNAINYAYQGSSCIGVVDFDEYTEGSKVLDYTFTALNNGDVNPENRNKKDRYTLIIAGSLGDLTGSICSSSVSYILDKWDFDIELSYQSTSDLICMGQKVDLQILSENLPSGVHYDWYEWEIEGDYNWDIQDIEDLQLINPKLVGRSGADGKISVYPQKTCVYKVEGFCEDDQYVIVNVLPDVGIYFTENDEKYIHPQTGVFTFRICSNNQSFLLPCFDTYPPLGKGEGQIEAVYYKVYRVNENREEIGECLKEGTIENKNSIIGEIPSVLTQQDINEGNHTENFVILISLMENPQEGQCVNRIYFNLRNISDKAVWDPQPGNKDNWNHDGNWKVYSSKAIYDIQVLPYEAGVPMSCTEVMIQGNSSWYPDLMSAEEYINRKEENLLQLPSDYNFSPHPTCNIITFEMGGKLGNQHHLDYRKAFIEYNFGYYDINNNLINGKPSSQLMRRDRFYTITIPLRDMVIGDFSFGGKPNAYSRYAEVIEGTSTEYLDANIEMTDPIPFYNVELKAGFGFAYKVLPFGEAETQNQKNINRTRGVIRLPNFEEEKDGMLIENYGQNHHNVWDKNNLTNTFHYFLLGYPDNRIPAKTDTKKRCMWEKDKTIFAGYRFISEEIFEEEPDAGTIKIKAPKTTAHILVGNPFFSYLNFNAFYECNKGRIHNYYYVYDGEQVLAYYPDRNISTLNGGGDIYDDQINANGYIIPSQAFFVDPIMEGLEFDVNLNAAMTEVNPAILQRMSLRNGEDAASILKVSAENSDYKSTAVIICNNHSNSGGGVPKIFSDKKSIPEIYIKQDGILKSIVEIGERKSTIPLGIKTNRRNTNITISISGIEEFNMNYDLYLYDSTLEIKKKLSISDFSYTFFNKEGNQPDRFYLLFSSPDTGINQKEEQEEILIHVTDNILRVVSPQTTTLQKINIYNIQGQILNSYTDINDFIFQNSIELESGVYLIEVNTNNGIYNKKIIIK